MRRFLAVALVALALAAACATVPPIADLSMLNGRWAGFGLIAQGGNASVEWIIRDGRFDSTITSADGSVVKNSGTITIVDGALIWENPVNTGILKLRDDRGRRVLVLEGENKQTGLPIWGELTETR